MKQTQKIRQSPKLYGRTAAQVSAVAGTSMTRLSHLTDSYRTPAAQVSLRQIDPISFRLLTATRVPNTPTLEVGGRSLSVIDTIPYGRAFFECYAGAVVMVQGKQYVASMARH